MLDSFDWIRRAESGAELIATLEFLDTLPDLFSDELEMGPPASALGGPCRRCWIYAPISNTTDTPKPKPYCRPCQAIMARAEKLGGSSRSAIIIWGRVNRLPRRLAQKAGFYKKYSLARFALDENHFILAIYRRRLQEWFEEMALYDGPTLKGLIQIFPTTSAGRRASMGELLCRAAHHEGRFAMDQLRVRFYTRPYQLLYPHSRDRKGILTFEASEFVGLLEMAVVFRSVMRPEEQNILLKLLKIEDPTERKFYWGRFVGHLGQEAKDMLAAWDIRHWSEGQIQLLYELIDYVAFYQTN